MSNSERPHYLGHRQRLRERLASAGSDALQDYELLELLLFAAIPRRDVKPLAKQLLDRLGGLSGVMAASSAQLQTAGLPPAAAALVLVAQALNVRAHRVAASDGTIFSSWNKLVAYCKAALAHEKVEQTRILFVDHRHRLLADEVQNRGTVDHTPAYPREIVRRALELGASAFILVHNHPSGDPTPSRGDIDLTRAIQRAAAALEIDLHDHLIVAKGRVTSFKEQGLL